MLGEPLLEAVLDATRFGAGALLLARPRWIARAGAAGVDLRDVSVIIPARNEEASLPDLLGSLAGTHAEVVVVDDESSDGTAAVARAASASVVATTALPPGWTGKAWACVAGASATTRDTLVFLDADVRFDAGGLERVVAEHRRLVPTGMLSVQPHHRPGSLVESLSLLFNIVGPMGTGAFTLAGARLGSRGAFGPCLVMARDAYETVGGHASVRGEVLDDVALARRFHDHRLPVALRLGRGAISYRMYRDGLAQIVEGWTKNFAGGAGAANPAVLLLTIWWISGLIVATTGLADPSAAAAVRYVAFAAEVAVLAALVGRFSALAVLCFPVPLAFFLAVFVRSVLLRTVRRRVRWRGRDVDVR